MWNGHRIDLKERSGALSRLLHLGDCVTTVGVLWLLTVAYGVPWNRNYTLLASLVFLLSCLIFSSYHLYRSWRGVGFLEEFLVILNAWGAVVGAVVFVFFLTKTSEKYSRFVVLGWFFSTPFVLFFSHFLARMMLRRLRAKGYNLKTAVIVGAGSLGRRVAKEIAGIPWAGIRVEGFFGDEEHGEDRSGLRKPLLGGIRDLRRYLQAHKVDYVILALPLRREKSIRWILSECRTLGAQLLLIPNIYDFSIFNAKITSLGGLLALDFNPDSRAKRTFDVAFSLLVLLGTLPLTLLIALLIKLQDGGPVFYRHRRITMAGKYFDCLKFRTMYVDADRKLAEILANDPQAREEWEKTFKLKNDPRVTWIGKFLRKTSLDELPQFLNVLKGDMSVVGARPIVEKELSEYYKENGGLYCSLKPGITGPWQVGRRSDTEDYSERVELDTWYVLNRTFWLDLKLICKTVFCVFTGRGAY